MPTSTPTPATYIPASALTVTLATFHGGYVTAMDGDQGWWLGQEPEPGDCAKFALLPLPDGKVAIRTCYQKYVTAPTMCGTDTDCALKQKADLGPCGQFTMYRLQTGEVAFETCVGRYFTALDSNREPALQWVVIARHDVLDRWERFKLRSQ